MNKQVNDAHQTHSVGIFFSASVEGQGMLSISFNLDAQHTPILSDDFMIMPATTLEEMSAEVLKMCEQAAADNRLDFTAVFRQGGSNDSFYAYVAPQAAPVTMDALALAFSKKLEEQEEFVSVQMINEKTPRVTQENGQLGFDSHAIFAAALAGDNMLIYGVNRTRQGGYVFSDDALCFEKLSKDEQMNRLENIANSTVEVNGEPLALSHLSNEKAFCAILVPQDMSPLFPLESIFEAYEFYLETLSKNNNGELLQ